MYVLWVGRLRKYDYLMYYITPHRSIVFRVGTQSSTREY